MKYILAFLFSASMIMSFAQAKKQPATTKPATTTPSKPAAEATPIQRSPLTEHFLRKYSLAAQWNDFEVAKSALYDLIIENPANDSLLFTLAYYYYENRQYAPNLLISQELLARSPKNLNYLEMAAVSSEALGVRDKALQNYETLYLLTNTVGTLYKIAFLQYDLKRYNESLTNVTILLEKPEINTEKVYFNDPQNKSKEYVMKVAVLNLKGLILQDQGDKAGAKKAFEDALVLAPDFVMAKESLAKLK